MKSEVVTLIILAPSPEPLAVIPWLPPIATTGGLGKGLLNFILILYSFPPAGILVVPQSIV